MDNYFYKTTTIHSYKSPNMKSKVGSEKGTTGKCLNKKECYPQALETGIGHDASAEFSHRGGRRETLFGRLGISLTGFYMVLYSVSCEKRMFNIELTFIYG